MKSVGIVALTLSTLLSSAIHGQVSQPNGQDISEDVLSRQVEFAEISDAEFAEAFAFSLSAARVPGGVVKIKGCEAVPVPQYWRAHISTLRDALESIVQAKPDYNWSMNDGVVNLTPKSEEPALLQTRINRLQVKDATSISLPLSKLMSLPEVRESIAQLGLTQAATLLSGPTSFRPDKPHYTIDSQNVTLKEALNTIVRAHGRAVWRYAEKRCNGKTEFSLDFVVE